MSDISAEYDVVVAGGGPAGAAAATLVAQRGHRVLLAERAAEPQFKVGESLMPATYPIFERLGILDRMRETAFPAKHSVQFFGPDGRAGAPFYFSEFDPEESSQTWQVRRSEFDAMLVDNAAEQGADVRYGLALKEVLFDGERAVGVRLQQAPGESLAVACKVTVDATGQSAFLARHLGLLETEPCLRNASLFTHYTGAMRDTGIDEGATLIFHTDNRQAWFWFIPQPDNRVSVGVVGPIDYLVRGRRGDPEAVFAEELARCPALAPRLRPARRVMPIKVIRDFSYRSREVAGDGWVLAGDAMGFIDPIYSTGVFLALKSGEMAADAIHDALVADDPSAERLGVFEAELRRGMEALRKLVYAYYDPSFSFGDFLRRYPHCREQLVSMLVGNVYRDPIDELLAALDETVGRKGEPAASHTTSS
jgi:flavin-dependent dehydrogenase